MKNVYIRDGIFSVGFTTADGKRRMVNVDAETIAEARYLQVKLAEQFGRKKKKPQRVESVDRIYAEARRLSQQLSLARSSVNSQARRKLSEAEGLTMKATDLLFEAWRES